jgi:hypothetical protein
MSGANVNLPLPLIRDNPWFPGQMGVPGTDLETGLRSHPTGTVFYVDPNFPGASDQRDGTNPTDPLATVAAALTKCQAYRGDTILVGHNAGWSYSEYMIGGIDNGYIVPVVEAVEITVPGVRLVGAAQSSPVGVPWIIPAVGPAITVSALDVLIEGFAFEGLIAGGDAIYAEWDGATLFADNLVVRHCLFDGTIDTAIQLEFVWNADIHDNVFHECDEYGIYVDPAGSGIEYCRIHRNWFLNVVLGALSLNGADFCDIQKNKVFNSDAQAGNAATDLGIDTTGGGGNIVADNYLSCILPAAHNGDYDDFCTAAATDAWINNHLMNGDSVTNPT